MAKGQIKVTEEPKKVLVSCGACKRFQRDTEGISYNRETGEYFMGLCGLGLKPDTPFKQFANRPRECDKYESK